MRYVSEEQLFANLGNGVLRLYSFTDSNQFAITIQDANADAIALFEHPEGEGVAIVKSVDNTAVVVSGISLENLEDLSVALQNEIVKLKKAQHK